MHQWWQRAARVLGLDATGWARTLTAPASGTPRRVLRADDLPLDVVREVGQTGDGDGRWESFDRPPNVRPLFSITLTHYFARLLS